ncbi:MAG: BRCT domain-containing protein, partial [Lachnospiraceae bacterium]
VNAKMLCRHFDYDLTALQNAKEEELSAIEGVGEVIAGAFVRYMSDAEHIRQIENLLPQLHIEKPENSGASQNLAGLSFVVTGTLNHFENRNALKEEIEKRGGKVTGSVTSKTECLINNDVTSASSKNKKAKELQVPILSEEEFLQKYLSM